MISLRSGTTSYPNVPVCTTPLFVDFAPYSAEDLDSGSLESLGPRYSTSIKGDQITIRQGPRGPWIINLNVHPSN